MPKHPHNSTTPDRRDELPADAPPSCPREPASRDPDAPAGKLAKDIDKKTKSADAETRAIAKAVKGLSS